MGRVHLFRVAGLIDTLDHFNDHQVGLVGLGQRNGTFQGWFACLNGFDHTKNILESLHIILLLNKASGDLLLFDSRLPGPP